MNNGVAGTAARERELVELYQELTGASESTARAVYMHMCCRDNEDVDASGGNGIERLSREEPARGALAAGMTAESDWLSATLPVPAGA